jgi:hypothetical protein
MQTRREDVEGERLGQRIVIQHGDQDALERCLSGTL